MNDSTKIVSDSQPYQPPTAGRPSVCRNCGALIGAGEPTCAVCGAPGGAVAGAASPGQDTERRPVYDRDAMRFARAILTRPAPFTIVLLVANIFLFLLTALSSGGENSPSFSSVLVAYGAKTNSLINAGQWWRFVTPVFLHGGIVHLLMNMYGLWVLGPYVERLYGSAKFVFFWVLTGIAGVLGSYLTVRPGMQLNVASRFLFKNGDPVSVGASGALFGLIGVLFVFGIKFRHELPDGFKRAFGTGMLPTILLNVFIGFTIPVIDNAAHMGGLIAGAALALVVGYKRPGERASVAIFWHVLQVAALALVVLSFTMVVLRYRGPRPSLDNLSSRSLLNTGESDAPAFLNALNNGQQALSAAIEDKLEQNDFERAVKALEAAPRLDEEAGALLDELKALLKRAQEIPKNPASAKAKLSVIEEKRKVIKDAEAWIKKRDRWVETEGGKHGIKLVEPPAAPGKPDEEQPRPPEEQQRPAQKQRNQK
ncbi:MAG TPA: rhomboid family intramembrane serine protease [Pyrinomonadaceae bacterium]